MIVIDGSYGEGGGQIVRTSLTLATITGQPVRIERVRAGRRKPGLMPQHLTAVRAARRICNAEVTGVKRGSQELEFRPQSPPQSGTFTFDVAQAAKGGSAGSVSLILQTVMLPLALAKGPSQVTLLGGTHVAWSPPYDYMKRVYLPTVSRLGIAAKVSIKNWGWYPMGGGRVQAIIQGGEASATLPLPEGAITSHTLRERGRLLRVRGLSASSNLPKHIRMRQERATLQLLRSNGVNARVDVVDAPSKGQGTIVFLWAEFDNSCAGFTALGELGKPAEQVAEEAARELLDFVHGEAALDRYLADQLILPLALGSDRSEFTTEMVTRHLLTNAWVVNRFFPGCVRVEGEEGQPGSCMIHRKTPAV